MGVKCLEQGLAHGGSAVLADSVLIMCLVLSRRTVGNASLLGLL